MPRERLGIKPRPRTGQTNLDRYRHGDSQANINQPSKSSQKNKPEPRGVKQKTGAALTHRLELYTPTMPSGQSCRRPGSQNRKKGASI